LDGWSNTWVISKGGSNFCIYIYMKQKSWTLAYLSQEKKWKKNEKEMDGIEVA
jgi:hypothetical protein